MSEIPKGFTDNYSPNNKKIDSSGNLKPHPRLAKKNSAAKKQAMRKKDNRTPMQKMLEYEASLLPSEPVAPPVSDLPTMSKTEKASGAIGKALGNVVEKGRQLVDYDPEDRTTYRKKTGY